MVCLKHTIQKIEFRFTPYYYFFSKSKIFKVTTAFHCSNGFLQPQKYFFCLACQTICHFLLNLYRIGKIFKPIFLTLNLMPPQGSIFHQYYYQSYMTFSNCIELHRMFKMKHDRFWPNGIFLKKYHFIYIFWYDF